MFNWTARVEKYRSESRVDLTGPSNSGAIPFRRKPSQGSLYGVFKKKLTVGMKYSPHTKLRTYNEIFHTCGGLVASFIWGWQFSSLELQSCGTRVSVG